MFDMMDAPIVNFLENQTLEEFFELLGKYGVCTDLVAERNSKLKPKNRIFVGSITKIYKPKIRNHKKYKCIYSLSAVNLVTKNNEKGIPIRVVLIGNVAKELIEAKLKKEDIIAILNPLFFAVDYLDSQLASVTTGPMNVVLWLCRNQEESNIRAKSSPKRNLGEPVPTSCQQTVSLDDTDADLDSRPVASTSVVYHTRKKSSPKKITNLENCGSTSVQFSFSDNTDADPDYCPSISSVQESAEEIASECNDSVNSVSIGRNNEAYRYVPVNINDIVNQQTFLPASNRSLVINKKTFSKNILKQTTNLNKNNIISQNSALAGCIKAVPNKPHSTLMRKDNDGNAKEVYPNKSPQNSCEENQHLIFRGNCSPLKMPSCIGILNSSPKRSLLCSKEKVSQNQSALRLESSSLKCDHRCFHYQPSCAPFTCCLHGPFQCRLETCHSCTLSHPDQHHIHCNSCNNHSYNQCHNCLQDKRIQKSCQASEANDRSVDSRNNLPNTHASLISCGDCQRRMNSCNNDCSRLKTYCNCQKSPYLPSTSCQKAMSNCFCSCHQNFGSPCSKHALQEKPTHCNEKYDPTNEAECVKRTRDWVMDCIPPSLLSEQDVSLSSDDDSAINSLLIQEKIIPSCVTQVESSSLNKILQGNSSPLNKKKRKLFNPTQSPSLSVKNSVISESGTEEATPDILSASPDKTNTIRKLHFVESEKLGEFSKAQISEAKVTTSKEKSNECSSSNREQDIVCSEQECPNNNQQFQESALESVEGKSLPRTQDEEIIDDNCVADALPLDKSLENIGGNIPISSLNNDVPNNSNDDDLKKKRKAEGNSQFNNEAVLVSEASLKKHKSNDDPAFDQESIKSIETVDLEEDNSNLEKKKDLALAISGCSNRNLSPTSIVSSAGTFHDARSTIATSPLSRTSPEQWTIKPIEEIDDYSTIAQQISYLKVIIPQKEPMNFKLYSKFSLQGIIINMIPSPDNLGSLIRGICHLRCKRSYEYSEFLEMEKMDSCNCHHCNQRVHYACHKCNESGLLNPLCLYFSFDIHLFVNDHVLRLEVEHQDAIKFLDCTPATYIRCHDRISRKIARIIMKDITSKEYIIYLRATVMPKHKIGSTVLTLCNTSLAKDLMYKNSKYNYKANK